MAAILKHELHRLLVGGIKYERVGGAGSEAEWEMLLFRGEELVNYLSALRGESVYEYVVYDSEVEREFARQLDARDDIKLFVKLPHWFEVDTPVGEYNPDWAILKHDGRPLYLVRETKGTRDFLKLGPARPTRCAAARSTSKRWGAVRGGRDRGRGVAGGPQRSLRVMRGQKPEASWPITQALMPAILGWLARSAASLAATAFSSWKYTVCVSPPSVKVIVASFEEGSRVTVASWACASDAPRCAETVATEPPCQSKP